MLHFIQGRLIARHQKDAAAEKQLTAAINANVTCDRSNWLEELLQHGDWKEIRELKKYFCPKQFCMLNNTNELVDSNVRAEVLHCFSKEKNPKK